MQDLIGQKVPATRFRKVMKLGGSIASSMREFAVQVASETAKRIILGP
jgi:hypothetical protein